LRSEILKYAFKRPLAEVYHAGLLCVFLVLLQPQTIFSQSYRFDQYTLGKSNLPLSTKKDMTVMARKIESGFDMQIDTAYKKILAATNEYNKVHDKSLTAYFNTLFGDYYKIKGELAKANKYYFAALSGYEALKDTINSVRTLTCIGELYRSSGEYNNAIKFLYNALHKNESCFNNINLANIHCRLASVYYELIINHVWSVNFDPTEETTTVNISCDSSKKWMKLFYHYNHSSLAASYTNNDTNLIIENLNLLGSYYLMLNKYEKATGEYRKGLDFINKSAYKRDEALVLNNLSAAYLRENNLPEALDYGLKAHQIALRSEVRNYIWMSAHNLFLIYKAMGDLKKSLRYKELDDSVYIFIINAQSRRQINDLQEKYLSQQKSFEIDKLKKEQERTDKVQMYYYVFFAGAIFISILLIVLVSIRWKKARDKKRKAENESLLKAELLKKAESANFAKSEFLANISHEIRTPLNAMLGFAELLNENATDPKYKSFIDGIVISGRNLLNLINDILDLSRLEAGKMQLYEEPVNLEATFNEIIQIFKYKAQEKDIQLNLRMSSETDYYYYADEVRLKQILLNLLSNSVKFTVQGEISSSLDITVNNDGMNTACLKIVVEDTGIGILPEEKEKVFDVFRQEHHANYSEKYSGTGLGLAITKKLVEMMHGTISIDSVKNEGTIVTVIIPKVQKAQGLPVFKPSDQFFKNSIVFKNATILLVEDIESNRKIVKAFLKPFDFIINEANNGQEALNILKGQTPDLILMDIQMPVMDGLEALKEIKKVESLRNIPIIALTAYPLNHMTDDIISEFDSFMLKPISSTSLIDELKKYLPFDTVSVKREEKNMNDQAKKSDIPNEVSSIIENEFIAQWKNVKKLMSKDDIEEFAITIKSFGAKNNLPALTEWADLIELYAAEFNIRLLYETFNQFLIVVNNL